MMNSQALEKVQGVVFDAYGTLFDVYSIGQLAETLFAGQGAALAALWRDKQIEYSRLRSMTGRYDLFWNITKAALEHSQRKLGLNASGKQIDALMDQYGKLSAFADVAPVLKAIRELDMPCAILTNGNRAMVKTAIKAAGIETYITHLLSSEDVQRFKPDPALYALAPRALKTPAEKLLFVSSNGWDASCANWYGFQVFWVNRLGQPAELLGSKPHYEASSLSELIVSQPGT